MATNPTPDIEVLKNPHKKKFNKLPTGIVFPSESKKDNGYIEKVEEDEEKEEWFESPNNFFYERKYIDF